MKPANRYLQFIFAATILCSVTVTRAQLPQVAENRLGVDSVKLDSGKRVFGFVLQQKNDRSLIFAAERAWLKSTHPSLFEEFSNSESSRFTAAQQQRVGRVEAWLEERPDDRGLQSFLQHELARFQDAKPTELENKRFIVLELAQARYRELNLQPANRRKVAGLAFQNELENVNTTPVSQLQKQLIEAGVDIENETVNLSQHVPTVVTESDQQWAARKAVVEYILREPIEFQGTGSVFVRKSDKVDASALMAQLMGGGLGSDPISQIGAELGLPEFKKPDQPKDGWWKSAAAEAERDGFKGFAILRLEQNALSSSVRVESYFFALEKPGSWFQVAKFVGTASAAEQNADQIKRIQEDPQVKSALDALGGLGLADQSLIDKALRHGAATQQALRDASGELNAFLSQNSRELDSMPITFQP